LESGEQVGSNDYPHRYNNYEGFDFRVSGPWQEFPITRNGVYTGGKYLSALRRVMETVSMLTFCCRLTWRGPRCD